MPANKVRADYESLASIARVFGQQAESVHGTFRQLKEGVEVLQGGAWAGKGAGKFYQEMNGSVLPGLKRLADALERASETTRQISQVMKQAEGDAARLFRADDSPGTQRYEATQGNEGDREKGKSLAGSSASAGRMTSAMGDLRPWKEARAGDVFREVRQNGGKARIRQVIPGGDGTEKVILELPGKPYMLTYTRSRPRDDREKRVQALIDKAMFDQKPENFQRALDEAIKLYDVDVNFGRGRPRFDPDYADAGGTDPVTREIHIGESAFSSPGFLAATVHHEMLHANHLEDDWQIDPAMDTQNWTLEHVRVYDDELSNAGRFGLRQHEIKELKELRDLYYSRLTPANQTRADSGDYTFPH